LGALAAAHRVFGDLMAVKKDHIRVNEELISRDYNEWPTLVVECGFSQTIGSLRGDTSWGLDSSGGKVKILLFINMIPRAFDKLTMEI